MSGQQSPRKTQSTGNNDHELLRLQGLPPPVYQQHALNELIHRPATPPAFLEDLPERQDKRVRIARRWIIVAGILLFLFFTAILILSILLAFAKKTITSIPVEPSPIAALVTVTQTETRSMTYTATQTNWTTSTFRTTTTAWTSDIFTWTQDNPVYVTVTSFPDNTLSSEPTAIAKSTCDISPLYLASDFCVMVNSCNETQADIKANDCLNFCRPGLGLQSCQKNANPKEAGCCDHCGCRM